MNHAAQARWELFPGPVTGVRKVDRYCLRDGVNHHNRNVETKTVIELAIAKVVTPSVVNEFQAWTGLRRPKRLCGLAKAPVRGPRGQITSL